MAYCLRMSDEYYGPTAEARETLNRLLSLPATGDEQDWELELTDAAKLPQMLRLLEDASLGIEKRSALVLLLVHTIDELIAEGGDGAEPLARLRWQLRSDPKVLSRMRFYWDQIGSTPTVARLLA